MSEISEDTIKLAEDLFKKGMNLYQENIKLTNPIESMFDAALRLLDESIGHYPLPGALNYRAQILKRRGDFDGAIQSIDTAINMDPQNPAHWVSKGYILYSNGQYREVVMCYNEALKKYKSVDFLGNLNSEDIANIPSQVELIRNARTDAARWGFEPNWVGTYSEGSWMAKISGRIQLQNFEAELFFEDTDFSGWIREPNTSKRIDKKTVPYLFSEVYGTISGNEIAFTKQISLESVDYPPVNYNGMIDIKREKISGTWINQGGKSGKFEMNVL